METMVENETDKRGNDGKIDFREFIESLLVGIYQVNRAGEFVYCNNEMARILGYSSSDELLRGKLKIRDCYRHPEDRERLLRKMRNERGKFLDETLHWKTRQDKDIYLSDSCQILEDEKGNEIGVRGVLVEVWYRKTFDEMNEGIYKIGSDQDIIVKANQSVARMLGYRFPEEIQGKKISTFYKNPADADKIKDLLLKEGKVENHPIEMTRISGEELVVSVNASPVRDGSGNIIGREGILRDVTEVHKIREIVEDMPTGAYQVKKVNNEDRISYCNKAFARMFGFSGPEETIGTEIESNYTSKGDKENFERALEDAYKRGTSLLDYRLCLKRRTGEHFWVEIDSQLLKDHKGNTIGRQGTFRDATVKVQLEEILRRREDIQRFSHRFITPIMSIKSSADRLIEEVKQSIEWELLGDIKKIFRKMPGDAFTLLKSIKNLSKELFKRLEDFIAVQKAEEGSMFQLKKFTRQLQEFSTEHRIDDIIELRETHRDLRICIFEYTISNNDVQEEEITDIMNFLEVLDKLYILYIVQTVTNTSKIAYTEVENLRSYLSSGWEQDTKTTEEPYEYREANLYECINEVVNIYQLYAFDKRISLEIVSIDPKLSIEMSEEYFKIMMHNLIQNAVKYSYTGGRNIRIRVENLVKDVKIEISNFGVGILPGEIYTGKIFEYGYRGKLSMDWNRTGSGIGLSEALKIAGKHGGKISISSRPVGAAKDEIRAPHVTEVAVTLPKFHN
jgi:PAS domain S-box-containing protein